MSLWPMFLAGAFLVALGVLVMALAFHEQRDLDARNLATALQYIDTLKG